MKPVLGAGRFRPWYAALRQGGAADPISILRDKLAAWYDISDLSKLSQDTSGATPVTAVGQTVRRVADKSGNGNHAISTVGCVLSQDGNGAYYLAGDGTAFFTITGSASALSFITRGTGCTIVGGFQAGNVADPNARYGLLGNDISSSTTNISILMDDRASDSSNERLVVDVPQSAVATVTADGGFPANQPNMFSFFYDLSAPAETYVNSVLLVDDPTGASAPDTDMVRDLQIMTASAEGVSGDTLVGRWYGLIIASDVVGLDVIGSLEGYMADKIGGHPL